MSRLAVHNDSVGVAICRSSAVNAPRDMTLRSAAGSSSSVRRHGALAVAEAQGEHLAHHDVTGDPAPRSDVGLDPRSEPGSIPGPQLIGEVVEVVAERGVGGELRVDPAPGGAGGDHADVVQVGRQHGAALEEPVPLVGA